MNQLFTSESVTEGHPDKVCDQISDAVLDACLVVDPMSRVACETMITPGNIIIAGEITTDAKLDMEKIVYKTLSRIGYNPNNFRIQNLLSKQSPDISMGVNTGGAGDQGIMFGYATNDSSTLMPRAINLANYLTMRLAEVRNTGIIPYLKPDGKAQVTIDLYKANTIIVSSHHEKGINIDTLRKDILNHVIKYIFTESDLEGARILINPTGKFEVGGPDADCGLTGRKIIVDTYGGYGRHGGGAFSGKDPTKVDRSAAYMSRHIAKSIVASKICDKCEIQLAYAIGVNKPVGIYVNSFERDNDIALAKLIEYKFDLTPEGIINYLDLRKPIYENTASYGHFGRDEFSWEQIREI
jgi:S-adenosylmethionine synthetase